MHCRSVGKLQPYSWHHYIQRILPFSGVTILGVQFLVETVPPRIVFILSIFFYFPSLFHVVLFFCVIYISLPFNYARTYA